ncbi:MAG: M15 family metallopeptidase [Cyclobacteriaceae bacterium]|nr:M15 family metallopeptidase [Cyclobacteriaceae bacterium]
MRHFIFYFLAIAHGVYAQSADKDYLLGKFDPTTHNQFVKLQDEHTRGSARGAYLRKETYEAFIKMSEAARKDGVKLVIISATRNFEAQKRIWENKWNGKVPVEGKDLTTVNDPNERARLILLYSSMPATSRHHWGTDMDLNSLENSFFESGDGLKTHQWLTAHAAEYGFCQPYTSKTNGRTGYEEEKWHWSYLPLSGELLKLYKSKIKYTDIKGFTGSEVAKSLQVITHYVAGVACN